MSKNDKSPRERAKQIISDYESGSGRFSGMGKQPTFPSTNRPTYPATYPGTYGSTYGSNKVKDKPTGADSARSKMIERQQDPDKVYSAIKNSYQRQLARDRSEGKVPD